jgi:hypothetical protein
MQEFVNKVFRKRVREVLNKLLELDPSVRARLQEELAPEDPAGAAPAAAPSPRPQQNPTQYDLMFNHECGAGFGLGFQRVVGGVGVLN